MALDPASGVYGGFVPAQNARVPARPKKKPAKRYVAPVVRARVPSSVRSGPAAAPVSRARTTTRGKVSNPPSKKPVKPAKPRPPKPDKKLTLEEWLAKDAEYQDQLRQFARAASDFGAGLNTRKTRIGTDYTKSLSAAQLQRTRDLASLQSDYASRGILTSGLYGQRVGQYETDYGTQVAGLGTERSRLLQDIAKEQSDFNRQQQLAKEQAKRDAAARRAAAAK